MTTDPNELTRGIALSGLGRRVLVVEDEVRLARLLRETLTRAGWIVDLAHDGNEGLLQARAGDYDVVVLDRMLPGLSGERVLERLRTSGHDVPVVMLTASDADDDQVGALRLGADDYVTKPFSTPVLLARLATVARRRPATSLQVVGAVRLDPDAHRAWVNEIEVSLSALEFALVSYLMSQRGRAVSKQELLDEVWDEPHADPNLVEVCMVGLRRKLGQGSIQTVRNVGYRLDASGS